MEGPHLGGGFEFPSDVDPTIVFTPPNLTNDPTGMTGRMTEDAFVARFRQGLVIKESIMPWKAFSTMAEDDVRAIYRYIKTVPPVSNAVVTVTRERGDIEFTVTTAFLDFLWAGNRVLFRLRDPRQIEPVALMAYEQGLSFLFGREKDRVNVTLFRPGGEKGIAELEGGGL